MVSILITAHGKFPSGIYESLRMVFGINENVRFIDFVEGMSSETLRVEIEKTIDELLTRTDSVVCLTDIMGGTPHRTCAEISLVKPGKVGVMSGTNLPMLISVVSEMEDIDLNEALEICLETGKEQIEKFELKAKESSDDDFEDGI